MLLHFFPHHQASMLLMLVFALVYTVPRITVHPGHRSTQAWPPVRTGLPSTVGAIFSQRPVPVGCFGPRMDRVYFAQQTVE
jgi:hypothetical protein